MKPLFFGGFLKKVLKKPSEVNNEETKQYYLVEEIDGISIYLTDNGYFISKEAMDHISEVKINMENEYRELQIKFEILKRKYDILIDKIIEMEKSEKHDKK